MKSINLTFRYLSGSSELLIDIVYHSWWGPRILENYWLRDNSSKLLNCFPTIFQHLLLQTFYTPFRISGASTDGCKIYVMFFHIFHIITNAVDTCKSGWFLQIWELNAKSISASPVFHLSPSQMDRFRAPLYELSGAVSDSIVFQYVKTLFFSIFNLMVSVRSQFCQSRLTVIGCLFGAGNQLYVSMWH